MISFHNNRQLLAVVPLMLSMAFILSGCDNMEKDTIVNNFNISDSLDSLESKMNETESKKKNKDKKTVIEPEIEQAPAKELAFIGCYAVTKKSKAQLNVSERENSAGKKTGKLALQMKEPRSAKRVWDDPDNLEFVDVQEASLYFDINVPHIDMMVARPDRLFVLAHVNTDSINVNNTGEKNDDNPNEGKQQDNGLHNYLADTFDERNHSEYLVYFSDGSDTKSEDKPLDTVSANPPTNNTDKKDTIDKTDKPKTKKAIVKHTPIKPNTNVIYRVTCDKRKVNIL